jgi:hypothetical protein
MGISVGIGIGTLKDPYQAVQAALKQAKAKLGPAQASLAIAFSTEKFFHLHLFKTISSFLPETPLLGYSGTAVYATEGIFSDGIAIMLLGLPENAYFNLGYVEEINAASGGACGEELGARLIYGFKNIRRDLGIIFSDGILRKADEFLRGLQQRIGLSFPLIGACALDNPQAAKPSIYYGQRLLNNAACGLVLGGKISFGLGSSHGWKPLGKPRQITRSLGNIVYEIDGEPASRVYEGYFSCGIDKLRQDLQTISVFYPIGIHLTAEKEYLLRNLAAVQDDGSLLFQGNVLQQSQIRLMIGTKESCLEAIRNAAETAKRGLGSRSAKFVLVFDSVSRYMLLGRSRQAALQALRDAFGPQAQIFGLCTYAEIAPLTALGNKGRAYFHNQTATIAAIGE